MRISSGITHVSSSTTFSLPLFAQLRSACMGSVTHNILHVPSPGAMSCIIEENLQVCLLTCFMTQLFQLK